MKSKEEIARHFTQLWEDSTDDTSIALQKMFVEAITQASEQLTKDKCEHCGSDRIYHGPPDCPTCGAPNCCQTCCKISTLEKERDQANEAKERAGIKADCNAVDRKYAEDRLLESKKLCDQLREAKEKSESSIRDMQCTYEFGAKVMNKLCIPNAKNFLQEEKAFEFLARMMGEKEKAERKLQGVLDERKEIVERIGAENTQLRAKAEKAERHAAEMRDALESTASVCVEMQSVSWLPESDINSLTFSALEDEVTKALSADAGKSYVPLVDLKEARELLELIQSELCRPVILMKDADSRDWVQPKCDELFCKLQAFLAKL